LTAAEPGPDPTAGPGFGTGFGCRSQPGTGDHNQSTNFQESVLGSRPSGSHAGGANDYKAFQCYPAPEELNFLAQKSVPTLGRPAIGGYPMDQYRNHVDLSSSGGQADAVALKRVGLVGISLALLSLWTVVCLLPGCAFHRKLQSVFGGYGLPMRWTLSPRLPGRSGALCGTAQAIVAGQAGRK